MKILAVPSSYGVSIPISGGQRRFVQLVRMQSANGNKVVVFESDLYRDLEDSQLAEVHYSREGRLPGKWVIAFRDANFAFAWQLLAMIKRSAPEIVEFQHPSGMTLCRLLAGFWTLRPVFVYAATNVEADFAAEAYGTDSSHGRIRKRLNTLYASFLEKLVCCYVADHIMSISAKDKARFIEKYRLRPSKVTAINAACTIPTEFGQEARTRMRERLGIQRGQVAVVFVGARSHLPNVEAASTIENLIAPAVLGKDRRAQFIIAGAGFPVIVRNEVNYVGYAERIHHLLLCSDIAIAPIERGAGVKMKVIDYMAAGLAIVSTRKGVEGINVVNGEHALVVDHADESFAQAILELVRNPQRRARLGKAARELAIANHDWDRTRKELGDLYVRLVQELHLRANGNRTETIIP